MPFRRNMRPLPVLFTLLIVALLIAGTPTIHAGKPGGGGGDDRDTPATEFGDDDFQVMPGDDQPSEDEPSSPPERFRVREAKNLRVFFKEAKVVQVEFPIGGVISADPAVCTVYPLYPGGGTSTSLALAAPNTSFPGPYPPRDVLITGLVHGMTQVTIWPTSTNLRPLTLRVEVVSDPTVLATMEEFIRNEYEESDVTLHPVPSAPIVIVKGTLQQDAQKTELGQIVAGLSTAGWTTVINRVTVAGDIGAAMPGMTPGMDPSQPGFDPNQPGTPPSQPGFDPNQPGTPPSQPGFDPNQPGTPPSQPGFDPNQPGVPPSQPGFDPNQPGVPPNQPAPPAPTPTPPGVPPVQP